MTFRVDRSEDVRLFSRIVGSMASHHFLEVVGVTDDGIVDGGFTAECLAEEKICVFTEQYGKALEDNRIQYTPKPLWVERVNKILVEIERIAEKCK
jgi:hypothetical protein